MSISYSAFQDMMGDREASIAVVTRSGLDDRVWVPTIDGYSVGESECMSSTSIRRVKEYVEWRCSDLDCKWVKVKDEDGKIASWEYQ